MGDIKKRRRLFSRPRKLFDRARIDAEDIIVQKFGLKNKREIWKAKSAVSRFRRRAKALIGKDMEEQNKYFEKLSKMGLNVTSVSDALALTEENLLNRRLQTVVFKKGLANSPKQARQLIVHKSVLVDGCVVNIPSFLVTRDLESKISLKVRKVKSKPVKEASE
jgi:small subunit ribosomal protein S4